MRECLCWFAYVQRRRRRQRRLVIHIHYIRKNDYKALTHRVRLWNSRANNVNCTANIYSRICTSKICGTFWRTCVRMCADTLEHKWAVSWIQKQHTLNKPFSLNSPVVAANPYECYPWITDSVTTPQRDDFDNFKVSLETTSIKRRTHALNRRASMCVFALCVGVRTICVFSLWVFVQDETALKYEPIVFNPSSGTARALLNEPL